MTIINPRDMTRHYSVWAISIALVVAIAGLMYSFQPSALLLDLPIVIKPILAALAAVMGLLAISFKFVFAHEMVSWVLLHVITLIGTAGIGLFGYSELWLLYYAVVFAGLFILGPYLHFD